MTIGEMFYHKLGDLYFQDLVTLEVVTGGENLLWKSSELDQLQTSHM